MKDLAFLLTKISDLMPTLKHLSLIGNPLCPYPILLQDYEDTGKSYKR